MTPTLQSIPSPTKIREELERMVLLDLLGPVAGPDEEIYEPSVRDRYLVGMLAPRSQELAPEEFDELPQEEGKGDILNRVRHGGYCAVRFGEEPMFCRRIAGCCRTRRIEKLLAVPWLRSVKRHVTASASVRAS
jgi:hypothetical protein